MFLPADRQQFTERRCHCDGRHSDTPDECSGWSLAGKEIRLWRPVSECFFFSFLPQNSHFEFFCRSSVSSMCQLFVILRFLVHRYSVMRESVEANKIEGVDDVDTQYMETAKAQFNEDSDQVGGATLTVVLALLEKKDITLDLFPPSGPVRLGFLPAFLVTEHSCCSHMLTNIRVPAL